MTDSPNRVIIERIEPRSWALRVRDTKTDQVHELELRGGGPWKIELNGKAEVAEAGGKPRPQVAAPPDDVITLRLERSSGQVRVGAVGRGAKAWADAQGTLLGSRWFHDPMGAPIVLLEDRPSLVEEIQTALPTVGLDLSKYTVEPATHIEAPGIVVPAANTAPPASLKKSRRGFGGKVKVPQDADIELRLSNVERTDDREAPVSPADMVFPEVSGAIEREDPRMVKILHENIRLLSEVFIVIPQSAGYGFRAVELRNDRSAGVFAGLPIGTSLLRITLHHNAEPNILAKDWEPLRATLRALNRPARQFELLREHVYNVANAASSAARSVSPEAVQTREEAEPVATAQGEVQEPAPGKQRDEQPATTAAPRTPPKSRGRKKAKPEPGPGPGNLSWETIEDGGVAGLSARWGAGHFKLLQLGGDRYGLFYEHDSGGYETLLCGTLEDGKKAAGERASGVPPTLDLKAAQVACATTRKAGPPTHDEITLHLRRMEGQRLTILATGDRVHEWVFNHNRVLGHVWERGEDNLPMTTVPDAPGIVADLRKEFPGVNIDTSAYTKPKAEAPAPEPTSEPEPITPTPEPPPSEAAPERPTPVDDQASQDAELMRSFTSELDSMLDEED